MSYHATVAAIHQGVKRSLTPEAPRRGLAQEPQSSPALLHPSPRTPMQSPLTKFRAPDSHVAPYFDWSWSQGRPLLALLAVCAGALWLTTSLPTSSLVIAVAVTGATYLITNAWHRRREGFPRASFHHFTTSPFRTSRANSLPLVPPPAYEVTASRRVFARVTRWTAGFRSSGGEGPRANLSTVAESPSRPRAARGKGRHHTARGRQWQQRGGGAARADERTRRIPSGRAGIHADETVRRRRRGVSCESQSSTALVVDARLVQSTVGSKIRFAVPPRDGECCS
jgi:hypothetical protein